jgi:hypothetical protein
MRLLTLLLAILALLDLTQCGGNTPRVDWPKVAQCSTSGASADLLDAVMQTLLGSGSDADSTSIGDRAVSQLAALAEDRGAQVVTCMVDAAVQALDQQPQPSALALSESGSPETLSTLTPAQLAAARGRDFLQRVAGTRVERQ